MGTGNGQPYLYDAPHFDMSFNPKRVTQASWEPPPPSPPKPNGPLISFNRHPDSYAVVPTNQPLVKEMSPKVKVQVKWVRWTQLLLRVCEEIGLIGMLICVICIKNTRTTEGWILRLPPAFDLLTTTYAIYHLCRAAKGRTPASSASYHLFALITDLGLVPFYVFSALMARANLLTPADNDERWKTFFNDTSSTDKILLSTWLIGVTSGGMHLISACIDLYLVVIFRKIAQLPPDMNPLEDNLTRRNRSKHKAKSSSLSGITMTEKHPSSHSLNLNGPGRNNNNNIPQIPDNVSPQFRGVPFSHSRAGSKESFSAHTPASARHSRAQFNQASAYQKAAPRPQSMYSELNNNYTRNNTRDSQALSYRHSAYADTIAAHKIASNLQQPFSPSRYGHSRNNSFTPGTPTANANNDLNRHSTPPRAKLTEDNWFVHNRSDSQADTVVDPSISDFEPYNETSDIVSGAGSPRKSYAKLNQDGYESDSSISSLSDNEGAYHTRDPKTKGHWDYAPQDENIPPPHHPALDRVRGASGAQPRPEPLGMNPPTPPVTKTEFSRAEMRDNVRETSAQTASSVYSRPTINEDAASPAPANPRSTFNEPDSAPPPIPERKRGPPRRKFYGDLDAAMRGVREGSKEPEADANGKLDVEGERKGRVVSRSGVDVADGWKEGYAGYGRGRDVSGKIAEEGRGGMKGEGMWAGFRRRVSGR